MLLEEREKLFSYPYESISIGITEGGISFDMLGVPWEHTANAFNMKTPDVYFERADLDDEEIVRQLDKFKVIGCYIFQELDDYSFLSRFTEIRDLHIRRGKCITDLSFMANMKEWFMVLLEGAHLKNLNGVCFPESIRPYCMAFYDCEVEDISVITRKEVYLSELIIWKKRSEEEYQKWKNVRAGTYRFYDKES